VPIRNFYTHAWLPRDQFDEVIEKQGWIFARRKKGYLALYSQHPYFWNTETLNIEDLHIRKESDDFNREVIVPGKKNIWICQMGREKVDGSFETFIHTMLNSKLILNGLNVEFYSPGNGVVSFGWDTPLTLDGKIVQVADYPRYDNPYVQTKKYPNEILIQAQGKELYLNWETGVRRIR